MGFTTPPRPSVARKRNKHLTWETFNTLGKTLPPHLTRTTSTLPCLKSKFSGSTTDLLNQEVQGWGPAICVSTSLVGDSEAEENLRIIEPG